MKRYDQSQPRKRKVIPLTPPMTLPPTTTVEQDATTLGQRNINLIWETTQSRIALFVVLVGVAVNAALILALVVTSREVTVNQLAIISICLQFINLTAGIVIGFYFSRTNHTKVGGTGPKDVDEHR